MLIAYVIYFILDGYLGLIIFDIVCSWFPALQKFGFFRFIRRVTDAYLGPFRNILVIGFLDFTPVIGITLLELIIRAYCYLVFQL